MAAERMMASASEGASNVSVPEAFFQTVAMCYRHHGFQNIRRLRRNIID
jgi:hypothetical protein